ITHLESVDFGAIQFGKGFSEGSLAVWPEVVHTATSMTFRLRGWSPGSDGIVTHFTEPTGSYLDTCGVALSATHLLGFSGSCDGYLRPGRLWKAKREGDTFVDVEMGPYLPGREHHFYKIRTWGDYLTLWTGGDVLLVRHTDWSVRRLPTPEGLALPEALVSDHHLYVAYQTDRSVFPEGFPVSLRVTTEIVRYDLSRFDAIGVDPNE